MTRPWVACLCAAWCVACREYRASFAALAAKLAGDADFAWIDIEDDADALGDLEVDDFPTLAIGDGAVLRFLGPVLPQAEVAERLIRGALAGALVGADADPGLAARIAALVPARRIDARAA